MPVRSATVSCSQMPLRIALLRGVNVGGHKAVKMAALRQCLTEVGCTEVQTLLQSGNVVFRSGRGAGVGLERWLEGVLEAQLGIRADIFVRTPEEWESVIEANPFRAEASRDPARLIAMCFKGKPASSAVDALRSGIAGPERIHAAGRELYIVYPNGMGQSRLTTSLIDSKLGLRGTARNWNTVLKLGALVGTGS